uniref:Uncharacterized protein n=1 Tax=CrAss-like virus sp. ctt4r3 TaxID=2823619 RepID=A0A8S5L7K8_9CAUD|nr:MAG TPA: hypothetical protein [CrAss-like virus sp. ctt4r3]
MHYYSLNVLNHYNFNFIITINISSFIINYYNI